MRRWGGAIVIQILLPMVLVAQENGVRPLSRDEVRRALVPPASTMLAADDNRVPGLEGDASLRKSTGLAALYSLLVPGMGELYAGGFSSGRYFLIAEGALWITYAGFTIRGDAQQNDARAYAISGAGIDPAGKDDQFYIDIGNFLTTEEYNDKQLRDREPDKVYDRTAGYGWDWTSDATRQTYKSERLAAENTINNRKFVVTAILINHVISAINAARVAVLHNKAIDQALGDLEIRAGVTGGWDRPSGIMVSFTKPF